MVLSELTTYLAADGIGLVAATNLFYGSLDDTPDVQVCLVEYGGLPNEPVMGGTTVRLEFPSVQVFSRGVKDDYDGPRLKIQQVVASFTKIGDQLLSGVQYGGVMAKQPPFHLLRDQNGRHLFACNFAVQKAFSAT